MNFAITGCAGLIGSELCKILLENGHSVVGIDLPEKASKSRMHAEFLKRYQKNFTFVPGSIMNKDELDRAFGADIDVVFHLAAMLSVEKTERLPIQCLDVNVLGTKTVLDACVAAGIKRFIFASSSEVYGEPIKNPISEDADPVGSSVYARSKLCGEDYVKAYHNFHGSFDYIICRFFNTYGTDQVSSFVLKKFVDAVRSGNAPIIYGDGSQVRGYCHASDTANALMLLAQLPGEVNETVNVGNSDQPISLIDLAYETISIVGEPEMGLSPIVKGDFLGTDRTSDREIYFRYCDTAKLRNLVGFVPKVSLQEGIKMMVDESND